ncbi:MAG: hypothetical protein Q7S59_10305 [Sulfurimonas sp.]|nr:hypothetical protein [Sulfurimonas sp.]
MSKDKTYTCRIGIYKEKLVYALLDDKYTSYIYYDSCKDLIEDITNPSFTINQKFIPIEDDFETILEFEITVKFAGSSGDHNNLNLELKLIYVTKDNPIQYLNKIEEHKQAKKEETNNARYNIHIDGYSFNDKTLTMFFTFIFSILDFFSNKDNEKIDYEKVKWVEIKEVPAPSLEESTDALKVLISKEKNQNLTQV